MTKHTSGNEATARGYGRFPGVVRLGGPVLLAGLAASVSACTLRTGEEEPGDDSPGRLARDGQGLVQVDNWDKWPGKIVPVCFTDETKQRSGYLDEAQKVRIELQNSWAASANINYTKGSAATCAQSTDRVMVNIVDSGINITSYFWSGNPPSHWGANMDLLAGSLANSHSVAHEFGHALGFEHEFLRDDFTANPSGTCTGGSLSGETFGTIPNDVNAIMNSVYCGNITKLSFWDHVGVQKLYGPRVPGVAPLVNSYNWDQGDHYLEVRGSPSASWVNAYEDGWAFAAGVAAPDTVNLKLYWHAARGDYFSTATTAGQNSATAAGYTFVRNQARIYPTQQPGTIPLNLYWHAGRADNLTTANTLARNAALAAGYVLVRTEGYVFLDNPAVVMQTYWGSGRTDAMNTASNSSVLSGSDINAYAYDSMDSAILKYNVSGTTALKTYYSSGNKDYATATASPGAGYSLKRTEGYIFSSSATGLVRYRIYNDSASTDRVTLVVNPGGNYASPSTQGYVLPIDQEQ